MFVCLAAAARFHSVIIAGISLFVVLLIVNDLLRRAATPTLPPILRRSLARACGREPLASGKRPMGAARLSGR
jgi:hypothetical protein